MTVFTFKWPLRRFNPTLIYFGLLIAGLMFPISACVKHPGPPSSAMQTPEALKEKGLHALACGHTQEAYECFSKAMDGFTRKGSQRDWCECQIQCARACMASGHTLKAMAGLDAAEEKARALDDMTLLSKILALKGNIFHMEDRFEDAENHLSKALSMAENLENKELVISILNDLGSLYGKNQAFEQAKARYLQCARIGKENNNHLRTAIALTNAARIDIQCGDRVLNRYSSSGSHPQDVHSPPLPSGVRASILYRDSPNDTMDPIDPGKTETCFTHAAALLDEARPHLKVLEDTQYSVQTRINMALACLDLAHRIPDKATELHNTAEQELSRAVTAAQSIGNNRLASYALGYLGGLRFRQGDLDQALALTEKALFLSTRANAPESRYRWEWQYAGILSQQNRLPQALITYEDAMATLEEIRAEFDNCFGKTRSELRKSESELYLDYVDALLRQTESLTDDESPKGLSQDLLKKAQMAVEKLKVFELRDYFNDDCLGASAVNTVPVDELIEKAAVIYPVILQDRLSIIATFSSPDEPEGVVIKHYVSGLSPAELIKEADAFRSMLEARSMDGFLPHASKLYDGLIRPLSRDLDHYRPDTLVIIPDLVLRNIPFAALYDGSSYLIESYALAVTPGLSLTDPAPLSPDKIHILAVGMTEASEGFEALPGVADEIRDLSSLYHTTVLMDDRFTLNRFENALQSDTYNVVHIASHGTFSGRVEDSFILASDHKISFEDLESFVGLYRFRKQPLELLTLSACETATGNDQAVLGLAGLAVKIGARSVLATLWAVDDKAAAQLVSEFYRELQKPGISRAMALKKAKQTLLAHPVYGQPGYWAPFVLVNNWL